MTAGEDHSCFQDGTTQRPLSQGWLLALSPLLLPAQAGLSFITSCFFPDSGTSPSNFPFTATPSFLPPLAAFTPKTGKGPVQVLV